MKDYREKEVKYLMIAISLLAINFSVINNPSIDELNYFTIAEGTIASVVLSLFGFIMDSIITTSIKNKLMSLFVFPMEGEQVFTRIKENKIKDNRVSADAIKSHCNEILSNLPKDEKERKKYENAHWYKMYQNNAENPSIMQTQRDYLACRDMYIFVFMFIICYIVASVFLHYLVWSCSFFVALLILLILLFFACRNKMRRFVDTVIVVDTVRGESNGT